jgi:hypothetical protein
MKWKFHDDRRGISTVILQSKGIEFYETSHDIIVRSTATRQQAERMLSRNRKESRSFRFSLFMLFVTGISKKDVCDLYLAVQFRVTVFKPSNKGAVVNKRFEELCPT